MNQDGFMARAKSDALPDRIECDEYSDGSTPIFIASAYWLIAMGKHRVYLPIFFCELPDIFGLCE